VRIPPVVCCSGSLPSADEDGLAACATERGYDIDAILVRNSRPTSVPQSTRHREEIPPA